MDSSFEAACILEVCIDNLYHDQANYSGLVLLLDQMGFRYSGNLEQFYAVDGHVIFFNAVFIRRVIARRKAIQV